MTDVPQAPKNVSSPDQHVYVWRVESEEDYYAPDLLGIYESPEAAKAHHPTSGTHHHQHWEHESDSISGYERWTRWPLHIIRTEVQGMPPPPPAPPTPEELQAERARLRAEVRKPLPYETENKP